MTASVPGQTPELFERRVLMVLVKPREEVPTSFVAIRYGSLIDIQLR